MSDDFSTAENAARSWVAGWYRDHDRGGEQWWDGEKWDTSQWRSATDGAEAVEGATGDPD